MRTIGVITTNRADYGIYVPVLKAIAQERNLRLRIYVTGAHLRKYSGNTVKAIEKDGFKIAARVAVPSGDTPKDIALSMARITAGFAKVFHKAKPDILLTLGDRFDMHAAAIAAVPFNIPIAHIHGGESTQGSFDEQFRHSLTKLSHLHFPSTKEYAKRIIRMGEHPKHVIISGAPALDNIKNMPLLSRQDLEKQFGLSFAKPVLLTTFHPVTLEQEHTGTYVRALIKALDVFKDHHIVFTAPNNDTHGSQVLKAIKVYVAKRNNAFYVPNFGTVGFLSMMRHGAAMVGNSSSGIIEAASFHLPVVNIGTRQIGRTRTKNVIDVGYKTTDIIKGIRKAISPVFRTSLKNVKNYYGDGKSGPRIAKALFQVDLDTLKIKKFYDGNNI